MYCRLSVEKWPYRVLIYQSIGIISLITCVKRFGRRLFGADWNPLLVRCSSDFNTNNQIYIQTIEDYRRCWKTGHISHFISVYLHACHLGVHIVHISLKDRVLVNVNKPEKTLGILILILIKNNIECFHSRGQHLCKFMRTKESISMKKGYNSQRIGLGHQYGRRDVMWKHSIYLTITIELKGMSMPS